MTTASETAPHKDERRALIFGLSAVLCWSTVATAFKLALAEQSVGQLVFVATATSVLVLAITLACRGQLGASILALRQDWKTALLFGALNPLLYYQVLFQAYARLPAQVAQPINYTWAIVLALLAVPMLGHRLQRGDILGMLLAYSGVVVIAMGGDAGNQPVTLIGVALALASTLIWSGYWILNSRDPREPVRGLFQNFLLALPLTWLCAGHLSFHFKALAAATYVGIFEMGISFLLWLMALKHTSHTSRISNLIFLSPLLSLLLIYWVLGEQIHGLTLIGLALILLGLQIQRRGAKPAQG